MSINIGKIVDMAKVHTIEVPTSPFDIQLYRCIVECIFIYFFSLLQVCLWNRQRTFQVVLKETVADLLLTYGPNLMYYM